MNTDTVLFIMDPDTPDKLVKQLAEEALNDNFHIRFLLVEQVPQIPVTAYSLSPYTSSVLPEDWGDEVSRARAAHQKRLEEIKQILSDIGGFSDVVSVLVPFTDIKHQIAQYARVSDCAMIADNLRDDKAIWNEVSYGVLFLSPIGLFVNSNPMAAKEHVLIAWDSGNPSARATHLSLQYLKGAKNVTIACIDPIAKENKDGEEPGADLATWLTHHGCNVDVKHFSSGGHEAAETIQARAKELGADLVVMGAFGHSRMRQTLFGGTTLSMRDQQEVPVFLAH